MYSNVPHSRSFDHRSNSEFSKPLNELSTKKHKSFSNLKTVITQRFFELQIPDIAWEFIWGGNFNYQVCTKVYQSVLVCTKVYQSALGCTKVYQNVLGCSRTYYGAPKNTRAPRVYQTITECTKVYQCVQEYTKVYQGASKYIKIY